MSLLAIGTGPAILAILALIVGLVVLGVVIVLLRAVLRPVREISQHASEAPEVAPFLSNGIKGVDELGRTRDLCNQIPPLALEYLRKIQGARPPAEREPAGPGSGSPQAGRISGGKP